MKFTYLVNKACPQCEGTALGMLARTWDMNSKTSKGLFSCSTEFLEGLGEVHMNST